MKRSTQPNARSGISPWRRYQKRAYRYSEAYYSWFRSVTGHNAAVENENAKARAYARQGRIA